MKAFRFLAFILITGGLFTTSCDYVTDPSSINLPDTIAYDSTKRVALLEEWTGHTCIACPAAARTIKDLEELYGPQFCAIAIHNGWFAEPCPPHPLPGGAPPGSFSHDFRCPTANDYDLQFPAGDDSPPQGMINRLGYPGTEIKGRGSWAAIVDSITDQPAQVSIHLDHTYNPGTRQLNFTAWGVWMANVSGDYNVCVMLTEDNIIGWQTDGTELDSQFVFKHVLRECVNTPGSISGSQVATGNEAAGTTWTYTLPSAYTLPTNFAAENCHLTVFIYNTTTMEVMQARDYHLTE